MSSHLHSPALTGLGKSKAPPTCPGSAVPILTHVLCSSHTSLFFQFLYAHLRTSAQTGPLTGMLLVLVLDRLKLGYDAASSQLTRSSGPVQISDPTLFILFTVLNKVWTLIILIYLYGNLVTVHYLFGNSMRPSTAFLIHPSIPRIWNSIGKKQIFGKYWLNTYLNAKMEYGVNLLLEIWVGSALVYKTHCYGQAHLSLTFLSPKSSGFSASPPSNSR